MRKHKVIIAGGRDFEDRELFRIIMFDHFWRGDAGCDGWEGIDEVVSGGARGADRLGEEWAAKENIPLRRFPAEWDRHGKAAGYIRNAEMAEYADKLVAFWDGESRGTKHMIDLALEKGLEVHVYRYWKE
jgi:hypothetical protein